MGANSSTYEEDVETITAWKGVRLTENVINRMRGASIAACTRPLPSIPLPSCPAQTTAPLPPLSAPEEHPLPPCVELVPPSPSPPAGEPSQPPLSVESVLPSLSPSSVEPAPPPPSAEPVSPPLYVEPAPIPASPPSMESVPHCPHPPSVEPNPYPPSVETAPSSLPPLSMEPTPSAPAAPYVEPANPSPPLLLPPPSVELAPPSVEYAPPLPPTPSVEPAPSSLPASEEPGSPKPCPVVVGEEGLCQNITQERELQESLEQPTSLIELEARQRVELEKVQTQVDESAVEESLKQAILRDRAAAQDHRLRARLYAHQLEQRVKELKKQDALYKEQVAKLEWRGKRFYSAITESYQQASQEVSAKFRQYHRNPVCADLQREILKCYRENSGQTLSCSKIASLYLQCVSDARQNKTRPGH